MMGYGYGYGYGGMMGGAGVIGSLIWAIVVIDLVLLGIWLWKKISNK